MSTSICQAKEEHGRKHIELVFSSKCRERNSFSVKANLLVARSKIDLGKVLSSSKLMKEVIQSRKRIPLIDGVFVQRSVVDT